MTQTEDLAQFDPASFEHIPVLLNECLDGLNIDPAGTYLDGTAGGAGHSRQIALRLDGAKGGRLVSLDQDPDAVQTARARLVLEVTRKGASKGAMVARLAKRLGISMDHIYCAGDENNDLSMLTMAADLRLQV